MYRPHRDPSPHYLPSSLLFHDTRFPFLVYFHYINRAHSGDRQSLVVCAPYCAVRDPVRGHKLGYIKYSSPHSEATVP